MNNKTRKTKIIHSFATLISCVILAASILPVSAHDIDRNKVDAAASSSVVQGTLEVMFIDVGQGDSTLISCNGHYMLIDGGDTNKSNTIYAVLKKKGITHLDCIVATHPDSDHIGGLPGALSYADCDVIYSPVTKYDGKAFNKLNNAALKKNIPVAVPEVGKKINLGNAVLTVLGPTDIEPSMDTNDISIVLRMDYGNTSFLFTGDAEQQEQQLLMWNSYDMLNVDCLKASHHGSHNGADYAFIAAVSPKITVISCGKDNRYGHPHEEAMALLKKSGTDLYRTDMQGDIYVISDGKNLTVATAKQTQSDVWLSGNKTEVDQGASVEPAAPSVPAVTTGTNTAVTGKYVVNTNTKKFHFPGCSSVNSMKDKNKMNFEGDRNDLISQGYQPCKRCNP